jgi:hypothetical protein
MYWFNNRRRPQLSRDDPQRAEVALVPPRRRKQRHGLLAEGDQGSVQRYQDVKGMT